MTGIETRIDVDDLFGLSRPTVQGQAAKGIQSDLKFLDAKNTGQQQSPFTAEDFSHLQSTITSYVDEHPLGFLAKTFPIIAQSMETDALRRDITKRLGAYNFASGNFSTANKQIAALSHHATDDLVKAIPLVFNTIHRDLIVSTAKSMRQMADMIDDSLWGTSGRDEREMQGQFRKAARDLNAAVRMMDNGDAEGATTKLTSVLGDSDGYTQWFNRALKDSEQRKFAARVGVTMVSAMAAAYTGGAFLALMGGAKAGIAGNATSLLVSGFTMTSAERGLNVAVFNEPFFAPGTTLDKTVDFAGDGFKNAALFGWMSGMGVVGKTLPMMEGEPVVAGIVNGTKNFTFELGSLTGFNMVASTANLIDPDHHAPLEQVVSRQEIGNSAAMLLGIKGGNMALSASVKGVRATAPKFQLLAAQTAEGLSRLGKILPRPTAIGQKLTEIGAPYPLMIMFGHEVNPVKALFNWVEGQMGKLPPIVFGAINVNLSYALSEGLRWVASTQFPELADHLPSLFQVGGDLDYFNAHNLWTSFLWTNVFGLAVFNPFFAGPIGAFSTRVANVKLDPKNYNFGEMTRGQVAKTYASEFWLRGLMGTIKLTGFHFGSKKGLAAGIGADIVGNGGGDMIYARIFKPQLTFTELFLPGVAISLLVAGANTIISQHEGFSHTRQYVERMKIGIPRSGVYRGFCASGTLTPGFNLAVQAAFGVWAIGHAINLTRSAKSAGSESEPPAIAPTPTGPISPPTLPAPVPVLPHPFMGKDSVTIAVADSGMGGLSVLADIRSRLEGSPLKKVDIVFFNALPARLGGNSTYEHHGYNRMSTMGMQAEVFDRVLEALQTKIKPDLVAIACNTLSVVYSQTQFARQSHPDTQVVTIGNASVDLMYKALTLNPTAKVVIMGTPTTVQSNRYQSALIARGISPDRIIGEACPDLATAIETDPVRARALIQNHAANVAQVLDRGSKVFVSLNCTHYGYEADTIQAAFREQGIEASILNPNPYMMNDHLSFQASSGETGAGPIISLKVYSQMPLASELSGGFVQLIEGQSPLTAKALREYTHDPNLFQWEDIVCRDILKN